MDDFIAQYRAAFEAVGRPLTAADAISEDELEAAQQRLGHKLPKALLDFYRVAGNADYFVSELHELVAPSAWDEGDERIIFMRDRCGVFQLGIEAATTKENPPVLFDSYSDAWTEYGEAFSESMKCLIFSEATLGAVMPFTAETKIEDSTLAWIESHGKLLAKSGVERAYHLPKRILFLADYKTYWYLWVGAFESQMINEISQELQIKLEVQDNRF